MKTNLVKTVSMALTLMTGSVTSHAGSDRDDKNHDYAYYIMSPKNHHGNNNGDKLLRLVGKSGESKSVSFKGTVIIPDTVKVNAGLVRIGSSSLYLSFDNIQCKYETRVNKSFFNFTYPLVSCSDGSRARDEIQVNSKISLYLKEAKLFPATAYANIKVLDAFAKGISLPQLEADKGQILRFDGELWVPTDYIPDGQVSGDVLVWDGTGWSASKITGTAGPAGANGAAGEKGEKGDIGVMGPTGLTGVTGATGAQGPQGPAGLNGANGAAGIAGAAGVAGAKGDKGEKGDAGDPGLVSLTAGNGIAGTTISGNGGVISVNTGTGVGQIPVIGANGRLPASIVDTAQKIVYIKDIKPNGVHGGSCDPAKGFEQIRDLNTLSGDSSFVGVANNTITLAAGTYDFEATAPAYLDGLHKAVLVNASTGAIVIVGSNARSHNISGGMESSRILGVFTISEATSFVIKHRCGTSMPNIGFGAAVSFGVEEVYTQVKITKAK